MSDVMILLLLIGVIGGTSGTICIIIASKKRGDGAFAWGFMGAILIILTLCGLGVSVEKIFKDNTNVNCGWHHTPLETK